MKFRCRMVDVTAMRDFTNIVNTISRITKQCTLRLTPNELCFSVGDDRAAMIWAELIQTHFFTEYIMNGVSEEQNEIYLEFDPTMLGRSLTSLRMTAKSVKIKLTNKRQPCLTIEIELPSLSIESRQCLHDVPVRVIPRREWAEHQAPNIPEFDISVDMPQLKYIRNIVERMKNMSQWLTLSADNTGTLVLKIDNDSATVSTHFQDLQIWSCSQQNREDKVSATIDIKKFLMFLAWDIVHPDGVKCNILQDRMINLFLHLADYLKIHYFLPSVAI
ncbi:Checkpoint protein HUS1 [Eufriesea mexicana]|uniref:checkpoint protein HUS1 n=1 Tax=Eufriesea mexicana TaxID=516756 RepID=UPI00083BF907|nr:PREDICTED: checkpoint protein HUS1 [Eufriesea mexicana]OAD59651.1 Checkpoint protein HUS1 [Eufriesea mexicana]